MGRRGERERELESDRATGLESKSESERARERELGEKMESKRGERKKGRGKRKNIEKETAGRRRGRGGKGAHVPHHGGKLCPTRHCEQISDSEERVAKGSIIFIIPWIMSHIYFFRNLLIWEMLLCGFFHFFPSWSV